MAIRAISVKYLGWRYSGGALQILSYTRATTTKLPTFFLLSFLSELSEIVRFSEQMGEPETHR
jgi:hypothetical protein